MSGMLHLESSQALGTTGPYAKRYRVWPPEGYVPPAAEEFRALAEKIRRHGTYTITRSGRDKIPDEVILRQTQLIELLDQQGFSGAKVYAYARWLQDEIRRRKLTHTSIKILRCGMCSHGTERLFEATGETHSITDRNDEPIKSTFLCAKCWSDYLTDNEEN